MSKHRCICHKEAPRFIGDTPGLVCEYCMTGIEEREPGHIIALRELPPIDEGRWICFECGQEFSGDRCPCKEE